MRPARIVLAPTVTRVGTAAELADLIAARGPAVVLTGAGMSTESGIPDFRSAAGIWAEVDPFEVASIDAFRRDPLRVWRWYGPRIDGLLAARPNAGHEALAALERAGLRPGRPHAEHRHAARTRGQRVGRRAARLDRELHLPGVRRARAARRGPGAAARPRGARVPGLRHDPEAGCRDVRRAASGRRVRARRAARARGRRPRRRRLVAPGLAGRRAPGRDAPRRRVRWQS